MCYVEQWDRVYQDGRREPQQRYCYCPQRHDPGHSGVVQFRTLPDEHVATPPRAFRTNSSRTAGMAEYPIIIEPRAQPEAPTEPRTERKNGKKKAPVVTKNSRFTMSFHIPFTRRTPKPKKQPKVERPAIEVVDPSEPPARPTVTYVYPQPYAEGPYQPYESPHRPSYERYRNDVPYHEEPSRPAEYHEPIQTYPAVEPVQVYPPEQRNQSRDRRRTVNFGPEFQVPIPPVWEQRTPHERPSSTVIVPEVREESPPIFREHPTRAQRPVTVTRSPSRERRLRTRDSSRERRARTRDSTPAPRIPVREHGGRRMPRAPSPPRRNHSPRRLRRIEEDIQRVERDLHNARQQARIEDAERRERRLVRIERDLRNLYDQQNAEIELEHQLRAVRENQTRFQAERRDRIPRDRARPLTIHQTVLRPRRGRDLTGDRNDFAAQGTRVINQAIDNRREERNNRDRRNERRDDRRMERRESSAHREPRDRNGGGRAQRRNTIIGVDPLIWDDDRQRRQRRWF